MGNIWEYPQDYAQVNPVFNPFTSKIDQFQISPPASPEILHHTIWRMWLSIAYSDKRLLYFQPTSTHLFLKGWENVLFELGIERVKAAKPGSHV